jgi:hypothetical protein
MTLRRDHEILVRRGLVSIPRAGRTPLDRARLATIASNLTYFGYALSHEAFAALAGASEVDVDRWWPELEAALASITGDDRRMGDHVVYKNFPGEVLAMSESDYWLRQILMYWGLPNELFTAPEAPRAAMDESVSLRVLGLASEHALEDALHANLRLPARWTSGQWEEVEHLLPRYLDRVDVSSVPFKENQMRLAAKMIALGGRPRVATATDVLRLAVAMSGGDVALREPSKLRGFKRPERRALLAMLEATERLDEDVARRPERFKRLFRALRPGDHASRFPRTCAAYDRVYRDAPIQTWNSRLEAALAARDPAALTMLAERPGEMLRRLVDALRRFGADAAGTFVAVMPSLRTEQLLKVLRTLETLHARAHRVFPPKGSWSKVQVREARPADELPSREIVTALVERIEAEIAARVRTKIPEVRLDPRTRWIKLQTNDSDLSPHGRGTVFPIPPEITFVRSASYWRSGPTSTNLWYDNGWCFFASDWSPRGACCWTSTQVKGPGGASALFSGDPTNSKDLDGRACQLIDLYLEPLAASGVRYAVWNVLCYSRKTFDEAEEVFAALMWGEKAESGKLFEPSRCQLSFPLRGANLTKYIAYLDLERRALIYLDANLPGRVHSAAGNTKLLAKLMPPFVESLDALPSVHDLFRGVPRSDVGMPVLYDDGGFFGSAGSAADEGVALRGEPAYVFRPRVEANAFSPVDLTTLLR